MTSNPPAPCFHCGEPCPGDSDLFVTFEGQPRPVCCHGCRAVAELILGSGLHRYYRFRQAQARRAGDDLEALQAAWRAADQRPELWGEEAADGSRDLLLQTEGVRCAACAWLIRSRLEPLEGIRQVQVDTGTGYTHVRWNPERIRLSRIALELARIGYRPHLPLGETEERGRVEERRLALRRVGVAGLGMMQVMMYAVGLYAGDALGISAGAERFLEWTSLLVTIPVVLYAGRPFFAGAVAGLRAGRAGMDLPVALAVGVAFVASTVNFLRGQGHVYFDSVVMFVFFLSAARYIQLAQRHRNLQSSAALARLLPEWAQREHGGGTEVVLATELQAGDTVRVRPGEAFPADGVIETGATDADEALLTGESRLQARGPGDRVVGGSINRSQAVRMRVTASGRESTLSAIGRMLLGARRSGSRLASAAERMAGWFVLAVLAVAALTGAWWASRDTAMVLPTVLAVLVVSCPCALSLATPAALSAAGRRLLQGGILMTRGDALENLARVDTVVFDKTGTLTRGAPEVAAVTLNPERGQLSEAGVMRVAAALEAHSAHPLARAFRSVAGVPNAEAVHAQPHAGLAGRVAGVDYRLGRAGFAGESPGEADDDEDSLWLADGQGWLARLHLLDALRPGAARLADWLRERGLSVIIASGDAAQPVAEVAQRLGIVDWHARQDPAAKMDRVRRLQAAGHRVLVVGDGVNDAPVLAAADVSMTVQGATELANSAADLILAGESLEAVTRAWQVADQARRVIRQNLVWAVIYNLLAVPLAMSGVLQPWMAALGMSLSSLLVVGNSARLGRGDGARRPAAEALGETVSA